MVGLHSIWQYITGKLYENKYVPCLPAKKIKITSAKPVYMHLDGDRYGQQTEVEVEMKPGALKVLVPVG